MLHAAKAILETPVGVLPCVAVRGWWGGGGGGVGVWGGGWGGGGWGCGGGRATNIAPQIIDVPVARIRGVATPPDVELRANFILPIRHPPVTLMFQDEVSHPSLFSSLQNALHVTRRCRVD